MGNSLGNGFTDIAWELEGWTEDQMRRFARNHDVNRRTPWGGETVLHLIGSEISLEKLQILLDLGADVNALADGDISPLMSMIDNEGYSQASLLLQRGADLYHVDSDGRTILHHAAASSQNSLLWVLPRWKRPELINATSRDGFTPLHEAVNSNNGDSVRLLLAAGATVDDSPTDNPPPLYQACIYGDILSAFALIDAGANVNARASTGDEATNTCLIASMDTPSLIPNALIAAGADVTARGTDERTALHAAAQSNNVRAIKLLLDNGAEVDARNVHGRTPLLTALHNSSHLAASVLLKHGADPNAADSQGLTPFLASVSMQYEDSMMTDTLLEYGANPKSVRNDGQTAIHLAAEGGVPAFLCRIAAIPDLNVSQPDLEGQTPLHLANNALMVTTLIALGAEVDARDKQGRTPLLRACDNQLVDVVFTLLQHGADLQIADNEGRSPSQVCPAMWRGEDHGWMTHFTRSPMHPTGLGRQKLVDLLIGSSQVLIDKGKEKAPDDDGFGV